MNDSPVSFTVYGTPKPQGSKRHVGKGILVESGGQPFKDWRTDLTVAARNAMSDRLPLDGPVEVCATFTVPQPKTVKVTGYAPKRPDLDKLARALLDALQAAGVVHDDGQVARLVVNKTYPIALITSLTVPGVRVDIRALAGE